MQRLTSALCLLGLMAACTEEPPPPSVAEFMGNPILLDATMVRCGENRAVKKYDPECVNAREAVDRLAVVAEQARREELDARSERKRQALRRAQEAAAEARRRALDAERLRQEAEYLSQFGAAPDAAAGPTQTAGTANSTDQALADGNPDAGSAADEHPPAATAPATVSGEEPPQGAGNGTDLEAVRDALQQRQEEAQQ
ncbi:MAG: EexN family lipoprotein [Woeseiaceae bacterium]